MCGPPARRAFGLALAAVLLATGAVARAAPVAAQFGRVALLAERHVGPREAAREVRRLTGGARVLGVRREGPFYRVKVLTRGGVVRVFRVDVRTGRVR